MHLSGEGGVVVKVKLLHISMMILYSCFIFLFTFLALLGCSPLDHRLLGQLSPSNTDHLHWLLKAALLNQTTYYSLH